MKIFLKVFAITTEILIWLIVSGLAEWQSNGGLIMWMLMFSIITATLRVIEKKVPSCSSSRLKNNSEEDEEEDLSYFDENKSEEDEEDLSYFSGNKSE